MLAQTINSIHIQKLFVKTTLKALFGRHQSFPLEIIQIILAFVFASPFKPKNSFILKQGTLLLQIRSSPQDSIHNDFVLSHSNHDIVTANTKINLKQGDQLMVGNIKYLNQKIRISKIWNQPQTKKYLKILTYCPNFKQFMLGKHHQTKMIDQRYLNREFLVPYHQKDIFNKYLKDIQQNDANFCSNQVLDSYMALISINYIQVQLQSSDFNDRSEKKYKIVPQGADSQIFTGIKLVYDGEKKMWDLVGDHLVVWKKEKIFSRKKTLIRTYDGKMEMIDGSTNKSVESFWLNLNQPQ